MPRFLIAAAAGALAAGLWTAPADAQQRDNVMIVFDGSNSMWGQIDGTAKIEIARGAMANLLGDWTEGRQVGLMAYGHRRRGDCTDIELLVTPGAGTRAGILDQVGRITPTGKTPLTTAVEQAARLLAYTDRPATVVLISDGLESCDRDPCALAETLERRGVGFTAHVVGFGLGADADAASLACIAEKTGGQYISAGNADELGRALSAVGSAVAQAPAPEPEPEPQPEPDLPQVAVSGPERAMAGSRITVSWAPTVAPRDYVTIVPVGTEEGAYGKYVRVQDRSEALLQAPGDSGLYELRYMTAEGGEVLGTAPVELTEPEVALNGPDSAMTGEKFEVAWTGTVDDRDFVTIVPMGAEEGSYTNYFRVQDKAREQLQAPADPGLYELRYVLNEGRRTMARAPIEITEPEVTLNGPERALAGEKFAVSWAGAVDGRDYITIVPMGAAEGESGNYFRVRDRDSEALQAPSDPGLYELRYVLAEGKRTMARAPIEITEPEVTLSGPDSALAGGKFAVSWRGAVDGRDFITIVPMGTAEGENGNYFRVRDRDSEQLQAPADPGLYELRYVLDQGKRTMARAPIEITEPEVTLSGPESALAGEKFAVTWAGAVDGRDYITIVPMGAAEGETGNYFRVRDRDSEQLQAPADPGLYELRYVLAEGKRTMARAPIEITEPEVTLSGPDEIRAGDAIRVSWTGAVDGRDYITVVPVGTPEGEHGDYFRVGDDSARDMDAPEAEGLYELRYVLSEGKRVLARHRIEVLAEDAALKSGASLTAPESAAPGTEIEVRWTVDSDSSDQRITLARGDQAIFTWIDAVKTADGPPVTITLPDAPGLYELRFLDVANREVLARKVVKVE